MIFIITEYNPKIQSNSDFKIQQLEKCEPILLNKKEHFIKIH